MRAGFPGDFACKTIGCRTREPPPKKKENRVYNGVYI